MTEQAYLRYRLRGILEWPNTPLRGVYLEAIHYRLGVILREDAVKTRCPQRTG